MAANDYYGSFQNRKDDPLPPVPPTSSTPAPSYHSHPPQTDSDIHNTAAPATAGSPFDDQAYPSYPTSYRPQDPDQNPYAPGNQDYSYHGAAPAAAAPYTHNNASDPFADQNAIPLQNSSTQNLNPNKDGVYGASAWDPENPRQPRRRHTSKSKEKKGLFSGRVTWVVYIFTVVQVGVFIGELIKNAILTKSPIQIHPNFNFMIGPSPYVLINMGARYVPCMHNVRNITDYPSNVKWMCPDSTSNTDFNCTLSQACGMGGVPEQTNPTPISDTSHAPNQWWRFIVPMFLHAGLIHIGFNMALQLTLGRDMEKLIGPLRFALVYVSSGIFGFVLGGNYAAPLIASTGASGALFGILALTLLDLLYNWSSRRSPGKDLIFILLDVAIAFVLGLLPGLDNFSHIGGFLMGLVLGVCVMHSPAALRKRTGEDEPPYNPVAPDLDGNANGLDKKATFMKKPIGFFKGRKPFWWAWWLARVGALVIVLIGFILLLNNFYGPQNECKWCYHLTCLPVSNWCKIGQPQFESE